MPTELGTARRLTVTVLGSTVPSGSVVGIAELAVPGLSTARSLALPAPQSPTTELVLRSRGGRRTPCVVKVPSACYPPLARLGEEDVVLDRTVTTDGLRGALDVTVWPRGGLALDALLQPLGRAARGSASSTWTAEPVGRPQAALDRDPSTSWWASTADRRPTLTVSLARPTRVSWLRIEESLGLAASRPLGVTVKVGSRSFPSHVRRARIPAVPGDLDLVDRADHRELAGPSSPTTPPPGRAPSCPSASPSSSLGEADAQRRSVVRSAAVRLPCGFGPTVRVGTGRAGPDPGRPPRSARSWRVAVDGARVRPSHRLPAGTPAHRRRSHRRVLGGRLAVVDGVRGDDRAAGGLTHGRDAGRRRAGRSTSRPRPRPGPWSSRRTPTPGGRPAGRAWRSPPCASTAGARRGCCLPAPRAGWRSRYAPDRLFRGALVGGCLALLVLVALAVLPSPTAARLDARGSASVAPSAAPRHRRRRCGRARTGGRGVGAGGVPVPPGRRRVRWWRRSASLAATAPWWRRGPPRPAGSRRSRRRSRWSRRSRQGPCSAAWSGQDVPGVGPSRSATPTDSPRAPQPDPAARGVSARGPSAGSAVRRRRR